MAHVNNPAAHKTAIVQEDKFAKQENAVPAQPTQIAEVGNVVWVDCAKAEVVNPAVSVRSDRSARVEPVQVVPMIPSVAQESSVSAENVSAEPAEPTASVGAVKPAKTTSVWREPQVRLAKMARGLQLIAFGIGRLQAALVWRPGVYVPKTIGRLFLYSQAVSLSMVGKPFTWEEPVLMFVSVGALRGSALIQREACVSTLVHTVQAPLPSSVPGVPFTGMSLQALSQCIRTSGTV